MNNFEKFEFWVPFYVKKVPIWSPFCSKLGPHWVPFLQFLGPLEIWVQLGWHEELQRAPEQLKPQAWCKPQALVSRLRTGFNQ